MEPTYKGHVIRTLVMNTLMAIWALFFFYTFKNVWKIDFVPLVVILGFFLDWVLPITSDLFFEAKHILTKDGIANPLDLGGLAVFGGMSILGLVLQIYLNVEIVHFFELGNSLFFIVSLAFLASLGACLGLTDLEMVEIFIPKKVIRHIWTFFKSWNLTLLCLGNTILISTFTVVFLQ